jgi:hypothetical protein
VVLLLVEAEDEQCESQVPVVSPGLQLIPHSRRELENKGVI